MKKKTVQKKDLHVGKTTFLTKFGVDDKFIHSCLNPFEDLTQQVTTVGEFSSS